MDLNALWESFVIFIPILLGLFSVVLFALGWVYFASMFRRR